MSRRHLEQQIQKAVADHLRAKAAPGTYWFHPANGGARTATEGAILKACGVRAGTPDLICINGGRTYGLELKAAGDRLSPSRRSALDEMRTAGASVAIATGIDEAILEDWGLLRVRTQ